MTYEIKPGADLSWANLRGVDLQGADLRWAPLYEADLQGAKLQGADLRWAELRRANLRGADLRWADLRWADLHGAELHGAKLPHFQIPQTGTLTVWKSVKGTLIELLIPAEAKRTATPVGRKCRAEYAKVLKVLCESNTVTSDRGATYVQGEMVYPDYYDDDVRLECTHGIHFYLTREEAAESGF